MSKVAADLFNGYFSDYEYQNGSEYEPQQNLSPPWSAQNITRSFSFGLQSPFKAKGRPNKSVAQQPTTPDPQLGLWDCSAARARALNFSLRTADELGFYSPESLGLGEAEAFGREAHEALRGPSTAYFPPCPLDRIGSELEQSSSSEDMDHGNMGLDFPPAQALESEGAIDTESTGDREWDRVVDLVQELTTQLAESSSPADPGGNGGAEVFIAIGQESDKKDPGATDQLAPENGSELGAVNDCGGLNSKGGCNGLSVEEIMRALSSIQMNVEKMKAVVPRFANERQKFTNLVHCRQARAAAGVVKLISQLATAAIGIIPEIQRQVDVQDEPFQTANGNFLDKSNTNDKLFMSSESALSSLSSTMRLVRGGAPPGGNGDSTKKVGTLATDSLTPTLAAVCITLASTSGNTQSDVAAEGKKPAGGTSASELVRPGADECTSLVAELLEPAAGNTSGAGTNDFAAGTNPSITAQLDQLWRNELENASRSGTTTRSSLGSESLPFDLRGGSSWGASASSSAVAAVAAVDDPNNTGGVASPATQDESDEGETRGGEQLPAGSFTLMEIDDLEILTEQTHFCNICSKGFKRDANLRMHMRSHGGKYKSSAALIRTERGPKLAQEMVEGKPTRYSCPFLGCNRNMKHPKFQALKTMLCLKNHYRRSHCPKTLQCSICKSKQFSVVADLKTHEKHCGSDKWACSCGTTFSRKEKLYGHVSLFVGHIPVDAAMALNVVSEVGMRSEREVPVQQRATEEQQGFSPQQETPTLWQDWENNTLYK